MGGQDAIAAAVHGIVSPTLARAPKQSAAALSIPDRWRRGLIVIIGLRPIDVVSVIHDMASHAACATAPANSKNCLIEHPAPVQVSAKSANRIILARSIATKSSADAQKPNGTNETARARCAKPHHPTAVIDVFCTQTSSSSNPSMVST
jgi:hypothetical protein